MNRGTVYAEEYFDGDTRLSRSSYTFDRVYPYAEAIVRSLVECFGPGNVLDVGCARGFFVHAFRRFEVDASGLDSSSYAISTASGGVRDYLLAVDIEEEAFPFASESFDLVTALHVLEHLQDPSSALSEMWRVAKQDAHILVAVPTGEILKGKYDSTHDILVPTDGWTSLFDRFCLEPDREAQALFRDSLIRHSGEFRESCRNLYRRTIPSSLLGRVLKSVGRRGDALRTEIGAWLLYSNWLKALEKSRGVFILKKQAPDGQVQAPLNS